MATYTPPKRGVAYTTYLCVTSQADTDIWQKSVTLAAGDVKVSKDGGAEANIATLPTEIGTSGILAVTLSATEMTADTVTVRFTDAAGDEWCDALIVLHTSGVEIDDLNTAIAALNDLSAADVNAEVDTALADYDGPTKTEMDAGLAALNDLSAADVWGYSSRTLTQAAASVVAAVSGSTITVKRGDSLSASLTGLGDISAATKLWFTVKSSFSDADSKAIIQIDDDTGLLYLNASAADTPANGSITVDDASAGDITIALDETETDDLVLSSGLVYDVQMLDSSGDVTTLTEGKCTISGDVTRAVA